MSRETGVQTIPQLLEMLWAEWFSIFALQFRHLLNGDNDSCLARGLY